MKKKTLKKGVILLAASTLSVSMLSGCSLMKPTANSLLKTCGKKLLAVKDMGVEAKMDFAMELGKDGASIDLDMDADIDMAYEKVDKGYETYMDANIEVSMLGYSQAVKSEAYSVADDKVVTTYSKGENDEEWTKEEQKVDDNSGFESLANMNFNGMLDKMTLSEETKEVYGRECYVLTGTVENNDMSGVLDQMDMDDLGDVDLDSIKADVTINIDKKDKMPVSIVMDIDKEVFNKIFENTDLDGVTVEVDSFEMEIIYNEINTGKKVDIPEEVFDAEEKKDSDDNNIFGNLGNGGGDDPEVEVDPEIEDDPEIKDEPELEDDPSDDITFGKGSMSEEEFKAAGFSTKEYVQAADERLYLEIENENNSQQEVAVYVAFIKDGETVDDDVTFLTFEPESTLIANFNIDEDYDEIEYTFEVEEYEDKELIGSKMDVTSSIDDDVFSGTVTNESSMNAKFVEVHVVLYNEDKEIIEHNYAYTDDDVIEASATSAFSTYINRTDYDSYDVYVVANEE